jgi:heterodisulfide reductase subunit A-like polyferredoxin
MSIAIHSPLLLTADGPVIKDHFQKVLVEEVEDAPMAYTSKSKAVITRNGEKGYYRNEELGGPIHTEREMRIVVIGAGVSGLCFAYKLQRSFEKFSLQLYEKNPDISGTWFENRYPGFVCPLPEGLHEVLTTPQMRL